MQIISQGCDEHISQVLTLHIPQQLIFFRKNLSKSPQPKGSDWLSKIRALLHFRISPIKRACVISVSQRMK